MPIKKISEDQSDKICSLYKDGYSSIKLGKLFNVCHSSILRLIKKKNIPKNKISYNRKYHYDINFLTGDSEELAYMMGFFFADGCLIGTKILTCNIAEKDKDILLYFCDLLKIDKSAVKIYKRKYKNGFNYSATLSIIGNLNILLQKWGIINKKTYNFIEPQILEKNIIPFILGIIDGDGSVYWGKHGYQIKICGNKQALLWIKTQLEKNKIFNSRFDKYQEKFPNKSWGILILGKKADVINFAIKTNILSKNYLMQRKWSLLKLHLRERNILC